MDLQVGAASKFSVRKDGLASALLYSAAQGTITADAQAWSSTATWNSGGTTFTHLKSNVTDTASTSASLLLDLQVASGSKFSVRKDGQLTLAGNIVQSVGAYQEMTEMAAPSAPGANGARFYAEDNGSGKTRLCAKFASGAAQCFATEP
jgi:hypothetical protein